MTNSLGSDRPIIFHHGRLSIMTCGGDVCRSERRAQAQETIRFRQSCTHVMISIGVFVGGQVLADIHILVHPVAQHSMVLLHVP